MQQTPQAPQPAPAPRPAAQPRPAQDARPGTAEDVYKQLRDDAALGALHAKRAEINDQIKALTTRRDELHAQRQTLSLEAGRGHEERIRLLDERAAQLERQLLQVNEQIARGISNLGADQAVVVGSGDAAAGALVPPDMLREIRRAANSGAEDGAVGALAGTGTFLVFAFLLYKGVRRWIWKPKPAVAVASGSVDAQQLAQLQRSIDVIAVEVERIAEAQRYVARQLSERALGAGEAQPAANRGAVPDPVERR